METTTEITVERELAIGASPETVWEFLVDPEKATRWMGQFATLDPRPGGEYRVGVLPGSVARGEFVEVDRPRRLVWTFGWEQVPQGESPVPPGSTTVEIELVPAGDGTLLRFTHRALPDGEAARTHAHGWDHYLERLATAARGGDAGPDPWAAEEPHRVVSHDEWLAARQELLREEKDFTRLRDRLAARRRELPWERVEREYVFDGARGARTLAELFDARSQLVVYHFMFGPDDEVGCPSCSFWADNFDPIVVHLNARDVTFVAVSRAPYAKLAAYRERMGWSFEWVSSGGSSFNYDYGVSFEPEAHGDGGAYNYGSQAPGFADREGVSVFFRDGSGSVFHTYSAYARGIDLLNTAYNYLDLVPKGRDENGRGQFWVRRHDEYEP